jgi:hypothetical protein
MPRKKPPYLRRKTLKSGTHAWFWDPPTWGRKAGCPVHSEPLGSDYARAAERVETILFPQFRAWTVGRHLPKARSALEAVQYLPQRGTLRWVFEVFQRSNAWTVKVSDRSRPDYRRTMAQISNMPLKNGGQFGDMCVKTITPRVVDKAVEKLLQRGNRTARKSVVIARRAWKVAHRLYPDDVPAENPFAGVTLPAAVERKPKATHAQMMRLAEALEHQGHAPLAAAVLICWHWLQRPENVLAGHLRWSGYRPPEKPNCVHLTHHKTNAPVWLRLDDEHGRAFDPCVDDALRKVPRVGPAIVMNPGTKALYDFGYARKLVRQARRAANLPAHVTMDACRHGGATYLVDAGATTGEGMAVSKHRTTAAWERYVDQTELQQISAFEKRRQHRTKRGDLSE